MIPLCDLVPARLRPVATIGLIAVQTSIAPAWPAAVLTAFAIWLFGPMPEDRLGRGRFVILAALGAGAGWTAAGLALGAASGPAGVMGAAAAIVAGHLVLYPRGRVLSVTPVVVGFEFVDLPSWLYAAVWLSAAPLSAGLPLAAFGAALAAGAAAGAAAARLLRRPERMRVTWWDTLGHAPRPS